MSTTNAHGQPVGDEVPGWSARTPPAPVTLEGRYVRLETISAQHAEPLFDALCGPDDSALWTYRSADAPTDVAAMARDVAALASSPDTLTLAIVPTDGAGEGAAAGMATYFRVDPGNGSIEVAAVIYARHLQRTRAATEAIHLMARHAFEDLGYRRFEWKCDSLNAPSARAARRLGFTYEGRFRQHMVTKGRNRDTDWFSITDGEWPAVKERHERWLDPANFDEDGRQRSSLSALRGRVAGMDQRISFVTLAVRDLDATRAFYVDGLGWEPALDVPDEVLMIKAGQHLVLSFWVERGFEAEVGPIRRGEGLAPITLSHNVRTSDEVDTILATARAAGADPVTDPVERDWGGYTGYFGDPDGFRWEIATNPGPIGQEVLP